MTKGHSLHIGLNSVDPAAYHGWKGELFGCENDARDLEAECRAKGFSTKILLTLQASAMEILSAIRELARDAKPGDVVVFTFSGHGGQVPDTTGSEPDGLSETWVARDRQIVDKEIYALLATFAEGVHVQFYSDSCHSGTVIRELLARAADRDGAAVVPGLDAYQTVYGQGHAGEQAAAERDVPSNRMIPAALALRLYTEQPVLRAQPRRSAIACGAVLISGCQDNQTSADGAVNGLFTEKLLSVWNKGAFKGSIQQFHQAILATMPPDQTPNYLVVGATDDALDGGPPFTVFDYSVGTVWPAIQGPASVPADGPPPVFELTIGAYRSGIVEIATDPSLFALADGRMSNNFYGSWMDSGRLSNGAYTVPEAAWQAIRSGATVLHYRVGSSRGQSGWIDYRVSTSDAQADSSPSIELRQRSQPREASIAVGEPTAGSSRCRTASREGRAAAGRTWAPSRVDEIEAMAS